MKPLILGEAPSKSGDRYWRFPLSGAVGQRLCTWAGIEPEPGGSRYGRYYWPLCEAFDLRNLLERYPGSLGSGVALPAHLAHPAGVCLQEEWGRARRVVVLLGRRLARLFDVGEEFFIWHLKVVSQESSRTPVFIISIPHPSGLNRLYNSEAVVGSASRTLREAREMARTVGGIG